MFSVKVKELNMKVQYQTLWRNKYLTQDAKTIEDMIVALREAADQLEEMKKAGVVLVSDAGGMADDYANLATTDPEVARRFGMEEEEDEGED